MITPTLFDPDSTSCPSCGADLVDISTCADQLRMCLGDCRHQWRVYPRQTLKQQMVAMHLKMLDTAVYTMLERPDLPAFIRDAQLPKVAFYADMLVWETEWR